MCKYVENPSSSQQCAINNPICPYVTNFCEESRTTRMVDRVCYYVHKSALIKICHMPRVVDYALGQESCMLIGCAESCMGADGELASSY